MLRSVLAKAGSSSLACGTLLFVCLANPACTPRSAPTASAPTVDTLERAQAEVPPINGIVETIIDSPTVLAKTAASVALDPGHPLYLTPAQEAKIDSLVGAMTVDEKAGQMNQYTSFYDLTGPPPTEGSAEERFEQVRNGQVGSMLNVTGAAATRKIQELAMQSRLRIPLIFGFDVIHGFNTQFPVPLAEAASWDLELIESGARWAAREATANGLHWTFAPMVDVAPDARWGRIVEGAGEDPYLGSLIAVARVEGFQGDSLSANNTLVACAKHLAGYGFAEGGRDYNTVDVSDYVLYNQILPPFRAAAEAGVGTFMNSFNALNGVPATGDKMLQREWLKGQLAWPGFIVSDWGSIGEMKAHGFSADNKQAALQAATAGSDMDMETGAYVVDLPALVSEGQIEEGLLDESVRRILRVKMALGLFDDPYRYCDSVRQNEVTGSAEILAASRHAGAASSVLLKNDGNLLPLDSVGNQKIVVIGDLANQTDDPLGTWSLAATRNSATTLLSAIKQGAGDSSRVSYAQGPPVLTADGKRDFLFEVTVNSADRTGIDEAVAAAAAADVVILAVGEPGFMTGESRSRTDLDLPGFQAELAASVLEANANTVMVLYSGRPLTLDSLAEKAPAILEAWQPGSRGNLGVADVLFGRFNPSGKLPVSFPTDAGQEPFSYLYFNTGRPRLTEDVDQVVFTSHYMDALNTPVFPFGHGLSYTTFTIGAPQLSQASLNAQGTLTLTTTVTNTGEREGTEVVQLYLNDPIAKRVRPVRELRGFERVTLAPGASEEVSFTITPETLQYWTPEEQWHTEPGTYRLMVGASSADVQEAVEFEFAGE